VSVHILWPSGLASYLTIEKQVDGKDVHTTGAAAALLLGPAGSEVRSWI
jgi:hypothetical protein